MWLCLLLLACEDPEPGRRRDDPETGRIERRVTAQRDPVLEVGTGELTHTPLIAGGDVFIVLGGQGGWHIDVSGRPWALNALVGVTVQVFYEGAQLASNPSTTYLSLAAYDPEVRSGWFAGVRAFLEIGALADVCPIVGQPVIVCAQVEDLGEPGRIASACRQGTARVGDYEAGLCGL